MNINQTYALLDRLKQADQELSVQSKLDEFRNALESVVGNPQDANNRDELASKMSEAEHVFSQLRQNLSPQDISALEEIGATEFVSEDIFHKLREAMSENPLTAKVARDKLNQYSSQRSNLLKFIGQYMESAQVLFGTEVKLGVERPEIGFRIPRSLFDDNLDGLLRELRTLRFIINTMGIAAIGGPVEIEIGDLSSSDPLLFFGFDVRVIAMVAASITWCLDTWQRVDKLVEKRERITETAELADLAPEIDKRIDKAVQAALDKKVKELAKKNTTKEEENNIREALKLLLERVERGLTVEIEVPEIEAGDGSEGEGSESQQKDGDRAAIDGLIELRDKMTFQVARNEPILNLEFHAENDE